MSRWYFLIALLASSCFLGCSSEDRDSLALTTPPHSGASLTPGSNPAAPTDHVAQRPPSRAVVDPATTDDLPLWPPTAAPALPPAPSPTEPGSSPPVPVSPVPEFAPTEEAPPTFTPPQFTQPEFAQPESAPAQPAFEPPATATAESEEGNPLRGSPAPPEAPQVAMRPEPPPLITPQPLGITNPLRPGATIAPEIPLLPNAPDPAEPAPAAPAPAAEVPIIPLPSAAGPAPEPATETAPVKVKVLPVAPSAPPAEPAVTAPAAPVEPQPEVSPPSIIAQAAPKSLPRVSIYAPPKPSTPSTSLAPQTYRSGSNNAATLTKSAIEAFSLPPGEPLPSEPLPSEPAADIVPPSAPQPRMMMLEAKSAPPAEPAPAVESAPEADTPIVPLPVPESAAAPAMADPPAFAPPSFAPLADPAPEAAPPPAADAPTENPPEFVLPTFETPAAELSDAPAAPAPSLAMVEPPSSEPEEAAPAPQATTALVPPETGNEPYDVVRVFYGTDRRPILVNEDSLLQQIFRFLPAVVFISLSTVGVVVVWLSRKITWLIGTSALMFVSAVAVYYGVTETLAIAEMAQREEPRYSAERSDRGKVELGICEVAIPKTHRPGELEAPQIWRFEREYDPAKHVTLRKTVRLHHDAFYKQLRAQVATSPQREILVFVHGFNVSFEDAARRTAQMAHDLKLQGAPVFYSWPADKYFLLTYGKDEASVSWSAPHLKEFLLELVHETDARAINLVAHSMGNRALTTALREIDLQLRDEARLFNQVVLAAPDIDADDFRDNIAPAIQRTAKQVTLYASSNDIALSASRLFHQNPRAGDTSRGLVLVPGMHTIDVSNIDGGPWGHSYYGASDPVLRDLHLLLTSLPPERRTWLQPNEVDGQVYWAFKPLGVASSPSLVEPR